MVAAATTTITAAGHRPAGGGSRAVFEHWMAKYRRVWVGTAISSFLAPLLYLAGMGFGLGMLVDSGAGGVDGLPYVVFVAPGVLAATAMQVAVGETSFSVLGSIKWDRLYHGMLATPLRPRDLVTGQLGYVLVRIVLSVTAFLLVATLLGTVSSWWALAAVPVAALGGLAFGACSFAYSATLDRDWGLTMMLRFVVTPMTLFAGTFFPVEQLPVWLRPVAWLTPLWHAVDACRDLMTGRAEPLPVLAHVAYLAVWLVAGYLLAVRVLTRRMVS